MNGVVKFWGLQFVIVTDISGYGITQEWLYQVASISNFGWSWKQFR
jgi:hypothetical protein